MPLQNPVICIFFSEASKTLIPWCDIEEHILNLGREIQQINRYGYCMMNAIRASLHCNHNIDLSERNMHYTVWREVKNCILLC